MVWFLPLVLLVALQQSPDHAAEGIKALEARDYETAIQHFQKAVAADPKDYSAHFHLGLAYSLAGKDAEAIPEYKQVLELKPRLYEAELNLGIVMVRQKQYRESIPYLESAARTKNDFKPNLYLGDAFFEVGEFPRAEQAYYAALTADAKSGAAELGLARAQARQGRLAEAEPHFRRAVDLDPALGEGLLELAEAYEKAGKTAEALAIYEKYPENAAVRERLGQLLLDSNRPAEAIPHFEWAVQHSPTTANRVALARAYRKSGDTMKALETLSAAVKASPGDLDLQMAFGRELRDSHKFPQAAQVFYNVTEQKPDYADAWSEFAAMLVSLEQFPQAIAALDRVRALKAEKPGHVYLRAIVLDRVRDLKGALAAYEQFVSLSQGVSPNEEFKARQRIRVIKKELEKR